MDAARILTPLSSLIAEGRLYPSVVLHGADLDARTEAALHLGRAILCRAAVEQRPCGQCANCRRIALEEDRFHPDFHLLRRDRPTVTSAAAVRGWVAEAQLAPFEGRAKVFAMVEAETLGADAADVLLKVLEEPPGRAARHFLLLTANDRELPATIRSRSMSFYLGAAVEDAGAGQVVAALDSVLDGPGRELGPRLAEAILAIDEWKDPRSARGWERAARALIELGGRREQSWLLDLAVDLMQAPQLRIRGIPAARIVEGSVAAWIPPTTR